MSEEKEQSSSLLTENPGQQGLGKLGKSLLKRDTLLTLLIIVTVLAIGLFAVNQFIQYRFSAQLLAGPCGFCERQNPEISCIPNNLNHDSLTNITLTLNKSIGG